MKRVLAAALWGGGAGAQTTEYSITSLPKFYGGPGSVTINGETALPGTLILVGVGPSGEEIVSGDPVLPDGSWDALLLVSWEQVHLFVDGFRVSGGPFDVPEAGGARELRLDVGVETDPSPEFVVFHARSEDITLFRQPLSAGAQITTWVNGERQLIEPYDNRGDWQGFIPTGAEEVSFTIDGFPVAGGPYAANPADAPFWITLHADDPERLPFRFHGPPGDIVDLQLLCLAGDADPAGLLRIFGFSDAGWEHSVQVQADGSWTLYAPSGTRRITLFVDTWPGTRLRYAQRYEALPAGGDRLVQLRHTETPTYVFYGDTPTVNGEQGSGEAFSRIEARRGRTILDADVVRPGDEYRVGVSYGTLGVSLWIDGRHAGSQLHSAIAGEPDPEHGGRCSKRVDLHSQTHDAPVRPPALLWRWEWLLSGAGAASGAALE